MGEQGWFNADQVKPRNIAPNPRCQNCQTGGMFHPPHPGSTLRDQVRITTNSYSWNG